MNKFIVMGAVLLLGAGAGYYAYEYKGISFDDLIAPAPQAEADPASVPAEKSKNVDGLAAFTLGGERVKVKPIKDLKIEGHDDVAKQFENVLNMMLGQIARGFEGYMVQRRAIVDLVSDQSLQDPSTIEVKANVMRDTIQSLREQAQGMVEVFAKADADINALFETLNDEERAVLETKWGALKEEHVGSYFAFFNREQDSIRAYARLMRFYKSKKSAYHFDPASGEIVFDRPEDASIARSLHLDVRRVRRMQGEMVGSSSTP